MDIEITKMSSRGQVVIPQDIREHKGIKDGERFLVYDIGDSIILKRIENFDKVRNIDDFDKLFRSAWKKSKERGITRKDVGEEISAHRQENA